MIGRLAGILLEKNPPEIAGRRRRRRLRGRRADEHVLQPAAVGEKVTLFTHLVVREDAHLLFGFVTQRERAVFRELIRSPASGRAPRWRCCPGMTRRRTERSRRHCRKPARLVKVPGIGKKTAERLLLELKGQLGAGTGRRAWRAAGLAGRPPTSCARCWPWAIRRRRPSLAVKQLPPDSGVSDGIKHALKALAKVA